MRENQDDVISMDDLGEGEDHPPNYNQVTAENTKANEGKMYK